MARLPPPTWGQSLWIARNPAPAPSAPLFGSLDTDVAIVGAGVSGLSLAYHLGEAGTDAVVLEAVQQPVSATAASAGVVAPQLVRTTPEEVLRRLGPERGGRYLNGLAEAGRYTFDLIKREAIACGAQPLGFLNPVAGKAAAEQIETLISEWRPFRRDLIFADAAETRRLTGCQGYDGCLVDPSGGGLDPLAFTRGLAAAAASSRVQIFRDSPVQSLTRQGDRWALKTPQGVLTARRVVLCANGGNPALHRSLNRTVLPLSVVEVATAPLPAALRAQILPFGHSLTDSSADVFSIRFDGDGRLITASPSLTSLEDDQLPDVINKRLSAFIPAYVDTPLEYAWTGTAWLNSTLLPRIVKVEETLLAVQACNGRGLAINTIAGREVARLLAAKTDYQPAIPLEKPQSVFGYALAQHIPGLLMAASTLLKKVNRPPGRQNAS